MKQVKVLFNVMILLFVSISFINAQQRALEGVVTDESGNPISGVKVTPKGIEKSVYTDAAGYYSLPSVPDTVLTLTFSHPDMETTSSSIGIYNKVDVVMVKKGSDAIVEFSLEDLLNMDVTTASKSAEKQSDAPGIISVVTKDELKRFGGTTLRDVLERVPGLTVSGANYTNRTTIAPRGDQIKQNSSHVLILINGRPAREVQEGGISSDILETFPVNIIERIEVIKGPGSVLYGSDAFSAVINVITEKAEKTSISVNGLAEIEGGYGTSGNIKFKTGDFSVVLSGRYLEKSEWDAPYTVISGVSDTTFNVNITDVGAGFYGGVYFKGLSIMTTYNQWKTPYISGTSSTNYTELKKNFNNLGYSYDISENWAADANVTFTNSKMIGDNISNRESYNLVAELTNTINLGENIKLIAGGLFNKNNGKETGNPIDTTVYSKGDVNSYALYAQLDYRVIKNLKLIGGVQLNKVGDLDLSLVPRGGVIWYPVERLSIKGLYSEAYRAPSINENNMNYGFYSGGQYIPFFTGDPDLKPEKVATLDIGISYQGEQAQLGVNFFHSKMTDIIQIVSAGGFSQTYANVASVTFTGVEFEAKYYVNKEIYINGSFLYQANENDSLKNISPVANMGLKAGISYMSDKGITVGLFDIYQGDIDDRFTSNLNPYQGAYNLLHLHTNFNLNKLFNWTFKPDFSLFINVDNLLDKPYYGYDLGGSTNDGIPSKPGRAVYFGLNVAL